MSRTPLPEYRTLSNPPNSLLSYSPPPPTPRQVTLFHAMGLTPMPQLVVNRIAVTVSRVVLLVPPSELGPLRASPNPDVFLSIGLADVSDEHFLSIHIAFVRVRRGGSAFDDGKNDWRSISGHLEVRDTQGDDPYAELMVSAVVPTFVTEVAPKSETKVQLRSLKSVGLDQVHLDWLRKFGENKSMVLYSTTLANTDGTAVLTPDRKSRTWKGGSLSSPLACPKQALSSRRDVYSPRSSEAKVPGASESPLLRRFIHGKSHIDQSLELMSQPRRGRDAPLMGRVKLFMANPEAREHLAKGDVPHVEAVLDPSSVRVILGEELTHTVRFPFPVMTNDVRVVYGKQGYVHFIVLPLEGLLGVPFTLAACNVEDNGPRTLLSTFCWPMCVPLAFLPKLDVNAEWAHDKVSMDDGIVPAVLSVWYDITVGFQATRLFHEFVK